MPLFFRKMPSTNDISKAFAWAADKAFEYPLKKTKKFNPQVKKST